ncbi:MAG TPA: SpoIID/LytB domain-containing protein [bacterium]
MKISRALIFILLSINLFKCTYLPPSHSVIDRSPAIRIGIAEKLESLTFETDAAINIFDQHDQMIGNQIQGSNWKVTLIDAQPVDLLYRLLHQQVDREDAAQQIVANLDARGISATIKQVNAKRFQSMKSNSDQNYQVFLTPVFQSESDAWNYNRSLEGKISTTPLPFFNARPKGRIILENINTGQRFDSEGLIRIQGSGFRFNVQTGEGYHFEKQELRIYKESLEFWIDRFGKLTVVNQIPLEEYLKGVVGSEMSPDFPLEALKAQAVTARSYTLSRLDKQHRLEPFDVCDEVHCHVYGGVDREKPGVNRVVSETNGQVLMYGDSVCETYYASVCGGHSENNENVWVGAPQLYLRGNLDSELADKFPENYLKDELQVRRWIETSPDVFCNTTKTDVPEALNYTKRYFRWTTRYTQNELSNIILTKTGENIGSLLEIIPVERGVSGRLKKIKLRGRQKTATVEGELTIRKALSSNYLFSSCFVVDRQNNDFIIKGAGWGHGVGMCQTGAAMMALKGFNYRTILDHYYAGAKLVKLY